MEVHDKMAQRAFLSGKTSVEFSAAAQRHANATWFLAIVGVVVWWFASWGWALIPFALAILVALQSISATMIATRLEKLEGKS
jgi:fatty acid desaturase